MELEFKIHKMIPKTDLEKKLSSLGFSAFLPRIFVGIEIYNNQNDILVSTNAIFDTGAPFSMIPISLLDEKAANQLVLLPHTIWGVNSSPDCHISTGLANVPVKIKDRKGNKSPPLLIPIAFAYRDEVPCILGMKGILDNPKIEIRAQKEVISIYFHMN